MNTKVALLLVFVAFAVAQSCNSLDIGSYSCNIDHPGHSEHGATVVIGAADSFAYTSDRTSETCVVGGSYSITGSTLVLSSNIIDLGCIVDTSNTDTVEFTGCTFNSGCNSFSCVSDDNGEGNTTFDCNIDNGIDSNVDDSAAAALPVAGALALASVLVLLN